uniref:Putative secreted protein n=1 Tax=Anopheles darlingi TaxID=43151 RepID=A0A2M4DMZ7_ANODA
MTATCLCFTRSFSTLPSVPGLSVLLASTPPASSSVIVVVSLQYSPATMLQRFSCGGGEGHLCSGRQPYHHALGP